MNVEIYSYSVLTTVLGMLVVFLSLTALSAMMVVLKGLFSAEPSPGGEIRRRRSETVNADQAAQQAPPRWLMAAVATFLAEEEEQTDRPSAEAWNAEVNQYDPWIAGGRFSRRGVER